MTCTIPAPVGGTARKVFDQLGMGRKKCGLPPQLFSVQKGCLEFRQQVHRVCSCVLWSCLSPLLSRCCASHHPTVPPARKHVIHGPPNTCFGQQRAPTRLTHTRMLGRQHVPDVFVLLFSRKSQKFTARTERSNHG